MNMVARSNRNTRLFGAFGRESARSPLRRAATLLAGLLASAGAVPCLAQTAQSVEAPAISAATLLVAGQPGRLTATARILTPPANPVIVANLLRVDANDKALYSYGHLTDDGKGGDAVAGDGIYTLQFTANETAAGPMRLRAFAAFKSTVPVLSSTTVVTVVAASTPIRAAVGDVFILHPRSDTEFSVDPSGRKVFRRQLEIVFRAASTAGEVNGLLTSIGATITGSVAGTRGLLVQIPDPGSLPALDALIAQIEASPSVWFVSKGILPELQRLPLNISALNPSDLDAVDHHLAVKAHAAWNAVAAATSTPRVVVADSFGAGLPSGYAEHVSVSLVDPTDFSSRRIPNDHGYHVLGIISGNFGGDSNPAGRVTGMYPKAVEVRVADLQDLRITSRISTIVGTEPTLLEIGYWLLDLNVVDQPYQVLNTSLADPCTQDGPCNDAATMERAAVNWIEKVRARGLETRMLHVTAAANIDPSHTPFYPNARDAMTGSVWNAAALFPNLRDDSGNLVTNLTNTLVIENARSRSGAVECLSETSFVGGSLSAVGDGIRANGRGVWSLTAPSLATGIPGTAYFIGTSMATPQVTGLAAYMWSIDPSLDPQRTISILKATANAVPVGVAGCSNYSRPAPSIDAYAALLALDKAAALASGGDRTLAKVRRAVLDVAGAGQTAGADGSFDENDLALLLANFHAAAPLEDYGRYDLNGDGYSTSLLQGYESRFDLDINSSLTRATADLGRGNVAFDETKVTDMDVLCYYAYSNLYDGTDFGRRNSLLAARCRQPVEIQVTPASATVAAGATVQVGAVVANASDTSVRWTFSDGGSPITSNNCAAGCVIAYTAPTISGIYVVTATSIADPTKTATATITVTGAAVSISIIPAAATVATGGTRTFTALLPPNSNLTVSWSVSPSCGSVSPTTGLTTTYTAPLSIPPAPCELSATVPVAVNPAKATITVVAANIVVDSRYSDVFAQIAGPLVSTFGLFSTAATGPFNPDPALSSFTRSCGAAASVVQDSNVLVEAGVLTRLTGLLNARSATGIASLSTSGLHCVATESAQNTFEVLFTTNTTVTFNLAGTATLNRTSDVSLTPFGDNWLSVALELEPSVGGTLINLVPSQSALSSTILLDRSVILAPGHYRFRAEARTATSRTSFSSASSEISMAINLTVDLVP